MSNPFFAEVTAQEGEDSEFVLIDTIENPTSVARTNFGNSVGSLGDNKIIIGTRQPSHTVYVYDITSKTIIREILNPGKTSASSLVAFGSAVTSLGDDLVIIGDGTHDTSVTNAGIVYVYDITTNPPTIVHTLFHPNPEVGDRFGTSLASLGENKIIVGSKLSSSANGKKVFVFDLTEENPNANPIILNNPDESPQTFGHTLAVLGENKVLVGDTRDIDNELGTILGAVFVFDLSQEDPNVNPLKIPMPPRQVTTPMFGFSIAGLGENKIVIGEPNFFFNGKIHVYSATGTRLSSFNSPDTESQDGFGDSIVAIGNDKFVVSAPGKDILRSGDNQGILYIYDGTTIPPLLLQSIPNPTPLDKRNIGGAGGFSFGRALDVSGNNKIITSDFKTKSGISNPIIDLGTVYLFGAQETLKGSVKVASPIHGQEMPLQRVEVGLFDLSMGPDVVDVTYTDDQGEFSIPLPEGITNAGLRITLIDEDGFFSIYSYSTSDKHYSLNNNEPAHLETESLSLDERADFVFSGLTGEEPVLLNGADFPWDSNVLPGISFPDGAVFYLHIWDFIDWANSELPSFEDDIIPLIVRPYSCDVDNAFFDQLEVSINLCNIYSNISDENLPRIELDVLAHEFGHYVNYVSPIGNNAVPLPGRVFDRFLGDKFPGDVGHDGYLNEDSAHSFTEGFAQFIGIVMNSELYSIPQIVYPSTLSEGVNYEAPYPVHGYNDGNEFSACGIQYHNLGEERAVASVLWDLYDVNNEPNSGDTFSLKPISQLWNIITNPSLNPTNPEIITNFNDLRTVLDNSGLDVDQMYIKRQAFLDDFDNPTLSACLFDPEETVGVTNWEIYDPFNEAVLTPIDPPRPFGTFNPRDNVILNILDPVTGDHLTDFDIEFSIEFEPPNDIYNFVTTSHVESSPYVFKGVMLLPSTLEATILKDDIAPETFVLTSEEFWEAVISAPQDVGEALITKEIIAFPDGVTCIEDIHCDDGISCTVDACVLNSCSNTPNDTLCDNGLFCDGTETCDAVLDCQAGTPPTADDAVSCTADSCDETNDVIVNDPDDSQCSAPTSCTVGMCVPGTGCEISNVVDGTVCEVNGVCMTGMCTFDDPGDKPSETDHYLGYDVKETKDTAKFVPLQVTLTDQFEENVLYNVTKPEMLLNPVDKHFGDDEVFVQDFETHLKAYKIKHTIKGLKDEKQLNVKVQNQFGTIFVNVTKADRLFVPTSKAHDSPVAPLVDTLVDHFKCYKVKIDKNAPIQFESLQVTLRDHNFEEERVYDVKKPKLLCNPVKKEFNGEVTLIQNPEIHLMCYDVKKVKGEAKFEKRSVFTNNQFGPEQLDVKKEKQICVPSTKVIQP